MTVRPAKTQISLGIRPVWPESSLYAQWIAKGPSFLHADSEDSDQTGRSPRLIWVFAGRTCHFVCFVMRRLIFCFPPATFSWPPWYTLGGGGLLFFLANFYRGWANVRGGGSCPTLDQSRFFLESSLSRGSLGAKQRLC